MKELQFHCPVEATLSLIGGKHKPLILWYLRQGPLHYMELQRLIPQATPPKTLYHLTPFGASVLPVLDAMCSWGEEYLEREAVTPCCAAQKQG